MDDNYRLNQFAQFDAGVYFAEGDTVIDHKSYERPEQEQAYTHIRPDFTVLELGGRYGVVSCLINRLLNNPKNHVVVEPDPLVQTALKRNRKNANAEFAIFEGIVTTKDSGNARLVQMGSASYVNYTDVDKDEQEEDGEESAGDETNKDADDDTLKKCTFDELQASTGHIFDCLVADIEGGLGRFLKTVSDISQFKMIMFECDRPTQCDYTKIHKRLVKAGFLCLVEGMHSCYININHLPFTIAPKFKVGFGTLGLEGTRGSIYDIPGKTARQTSSVAVPEHIKAYAATKKLKLHTICGHANCDFTLVPKKKLYAFGFLQKDIQPVLIHDEAQYVWKCNDSVVNTLNGKPSTADIVQKPIVLKSGQIYKMQMIATSPWQIQHAHTAWAIFEKEQD